MAILEYRLFRVKLILPSQLSLLHYPVDRVDVFMAALRDRPVSRVRAGYTWHIGNVKLFSPTSGYFAIGRTTRSSVDIFDPETNNFVEQELDTSPYTHCVFDAAIGFIGIAKKTSLSPTTEGIARRITEVLSSTAPIRENQIEVEIAPIPDPDSFLREIEEAYRVRQFAATFHRPNPFDADEYFQKPLAALLSHADGERGQTQLIGPDLNREVIAEVTRSTAATGNEASARIQREAAARTVTIRLRGSTLGTSYDEEEHDPKQVLEDLRKLYQHVRDTDARSSDYERR